MQNLTHQIEGAEVTRQNDRTFAIAKRIIDQAK